MLSSPSPARTWVLAAGARRHGPCGVSFSWRIAPFLVPHSWRSVSWETIAYRRGQRCGVGSPLGPPRLRCGGPGGRWVMPGRRYYWSGRLPPRNLWDGCQGGSSGVLRAPPQVWAGAWPSRSRSCLVPTSLALLARLCCRASHWVAGATKSPPPRARRGWALPRSLARSATGPRGYERCSPPAFLLPSSLPTCTPLAAA